MLAAVQFTVITPSVPPSLTTDRDTVCVSPSEGSLTVISPRSNANAPCGSSEVAMVTCVSVTSPSLAPPLIMSVNLGEN